jgi:hypothetical protein
LQKIYIQYLHTKSSEGCQAELQQALQNQQGQNQFSPECEAELQGVRVPRRYPPLFFSVPSRSPSAPPAPPPFFQLDKQFKARMQSLPQGVHPETLLEDESSGGGGGGGARGGGEGARRAEGRAAGGKSEAMFSDSVWVSLQVMLLVLLPCCGAILYRYRLFSDPAVLRRLAEEEAAARKEEEKRQRALDKKRKAGKIKDDPIS